MNTGEVRASKREKDEIRTYVGSQAHEEVLHLEKATSELVGPVRHDIWDVHCPDSRWWVVTNPTNLYEQRDFKSRDVVLTFHIDLTLRLEYAREGEVPVTVGPAELLPGSWCEPSGNSPGLPSNNSPPRSLRHFYNVGLRLSTTRPGFTPIPQSENMIVTPSIRSFRATGSSQHGHRPPAPRRRQNRSQLSQYCAPR
jgi:hypothetical protein